MKEVNKRTLYECANACVKGESIFCAKGYPLNPKPGNPGNGHVDVSRLARGKRLAFKCCQDCLDFDCMGPPVPPEERGWLKKKETK